MGDNDGHDRYDPKNVDLDDPLGLAFIFAVNAAWIVLALIKLTERRDGPCRTFTGSIVSVVLRTCPHVH